MLSCMEFSIEKAFKLQEEFAKSYKCPIYIKGESHQGRPVYRVMITEDVIPF
jgi:hypothetical protein